MEQPQNAVVLSYLSRKEKERGLSLDEIQNKLERYALSNQHKIIRSFKREGEGEWWQDDQLVDDVADFIEHLTAPITLICYINPNPTYKPPCSNRWNQLIRDKKLIPVSYRHPCFMEPHNRTKIWRYVSLAKFIDLIQSRKLFFTRADRLRSDDKYEGELFTKAYQKSTSAISKLLSLPPEAAAEFKKAIPNIDIGAIQNNIAINSVLQKYHEERAIKYTFINCWHMSEEENFAMWKIYADNFGVCIQSTYERLCNSFIDDSWGVMQHVNRIYIGEVLYINRGSEFIPLENGFWPFMHKGAEFSYEKELRCIISDMQQTGVVEPLKIAVNLDSLIEGIFVSPFAPKWLADIVLKLCSSYRINENLIRQSSLE